jgi:hypothetical protein
MLMDAENRFSDEQAITGDSLSENILNLGPPKQGHAGPAFCEEILLWITETFDSAGDAGTLQVQLRSSANADMSSHIVHDMSEVFAQAALAVGNRLRWQPRFPIDQLRQYVALYYDNGTAVFTAGEISAAAVMGRQTNR